MRIWGTRLIITVALLLAGAAGFRAWQDWQPTQPDQALSLEVRWHDQWLKLARTTLESPWTIVAAQPALPAEIEVNSDQVLKVIDLMVALQRAAKDIAPLGTEEMAHAGVQPPALALSAGATQFHFGNRNGSRAYVYAPHAKTLITASPSLLDYFQKQGLEGLLDLRLTALATDDIESFETHGRCRNLNLERNGDSWLVHSGGLSSGAVDEYLDRITSITRRPVFEHGATPAAAPWCLLTIKGRDNVSQSIRIWHGDGTVLMSAGQNGSLFHLKAADLAILD
jgi:hypothetical protein